MADTRQLDTTRWTGHFRWNHSLLMAGIVGTWRKPWSRVCRSAVADNHKPALPLILEAFLLLYAPLGGYTFF